MKIANVVIRAQDIFIKKALFSDLGQMGDRADHLLVSQHFVTLYGGCPGISRVPTDPDRLAAHSGHGRVFLHTQVSRGRKPYGTLLEIGVGLVLAQGGHPVFNGFHGLGIQGGLDLGSPEILFHLALFRMIIHMADTENKRADALEGQGVLNQVPAGQIFGTHAEVNVFRAVGKTGFLVVVGGIGKHLHADNSHVRGLGGFNGIVPVSQILAVTGIDGDQQGVEDTPAIPSDGVHVGCCVPVAGDADVPDQLFLFGVQTGPVRSFAKIQHGR